MANFIANNFHLALLQATIDITQGGEPVFVTLHDATFDGTDDDVNVGDITTLGEFAGTGYVRKQLLNIAITLDGPNDEIVYDADDVIWVGLDSGVINWAGFHVARTNDADSPNLWYWDYTLTPKATNGGDVALTFAATGIYRLGRSAGS